MGDLGKQPIGTRGGCRRKAVGPSFDKLPASRWKIKKRILKELIFGGRKQTTEGGGGGEGGGAELPPSRWKIKKRLLKDLFWTNTSV
ncbi:hypothetical protein HanRHA438_Chr05g0239401 [Helianthus annuus]|uniref:Uncharacterized protein n=1 Tax=Helianthus annuus TaxID=4232 RepID=A0A251USB6_HELAN|nr:hypothetical protein HanXRQr2_Chr05g0230281 [Helianthus annuus]KAJ0920265.1 hypothetical protein HanRHA438_Chr05g0239401 [Helianthus annuus]KAJ0923909.1 hypothetical protein HanPSC8_Chr05g0222141 [Helianthus annuus]